MSDHHLIVCGFTNSLNSLITDFCSTSGISAEKDISIPFQSITAKVNSFQENSPSSSIEEGKKWLKEAVEDNKFVAWCHSKEIAWLSYWKKVAKQTRFLLVFSDPWVDFAESEETDISLFLKKWYSFHQTLYNFYTANSQACVLIHTHELWQTPYAILKAIEQKLGFYTQQKEPLSFLCNTSFYNKSYEVDTIKQIKADENVIQLLRSLGSNTLLKKGIDSVTHNTNASIVIPVYNDGEYLMDALASVERSLAPLPNIIIVNDGSTDSYTLDLLLQLEKDGYQIIHQENQGLSAARNNAIALAKTDYVALLDADNKLDPTYIQEATKVLQYNPKIGIVYAKARVFGSTKHFRQNLAFDADRLLAGNYIDACTVIRKKAWKDIGGFDTQIPEKLGYEDWEFWLSAHAKGWQFHYIDKFLFDYRTKENSMAERCNIPENRAKLIEYVTKKHTALYQERAPYVLSKLHQHTLNLEKLASQRQKTLVRHADESKKANIHSRNLSAIITQLKEEKKAFEQQIKSLEQKNKELPTLDSFAQLKTENQLQLDKLKFELGKANDAVFQYDVQLSQLKEQKEKEVVQLNEHYTEEIRQKNEQLSALTHSKNDALEKVKHTHQQTLQELQEQNESKLQELINENTNFKVEVATLKQSLENYQLLVDSVADEKKSYLGLLETSQKNNELSNVALNNVNVQLDMKENQLSLFKDTNKALQDKIISYENSKSAKVKRTLRKIFDYFFVVDADRNIIIQLLSKFKFIASPIGSFMVKKFFKKVFLKLYLYLEEQQVNIMYGAVDYSQANVVEEDTSKLIDPDIRYKKWMAQNLPRKADFEMYAEMAKLFAYQPKISILVPAYNPPIPYFRAMIDSVLQQVYQNWELCISDDNSSDPAVKKVIKEYAAKDKRIKYIFRKQNGHISANSNSALEIATGEFCSLLDHDDLLTKDALYQVVLQLNKNKELDYIYTDEDKVDDSGQFSNPYFKPDFLPDYLLSINYVTHFSTYRKTILDEIGGFRLGFEGSQDHDLVLRFTEKTTQERIAHIPKILYHWRMHSESTAAGAEVKTYAYEASKKAITEALQRRGETGEVSIMPGYIGYNVQYNIQESKKVSIIIPTKDKTDILKTCVDSIITKTQYNQYEIIVVDNNSEEQAFFDFVKTYEREHAGIFKCYSHKIPFNFSKLMNFGAKKATGDYLLFMNNDMEVISEGWLEKMVGQVQRKSVGAVGAKLLFHDDTIQHAGVVIGFGGIAGHTYVKYPRNFDGHFNNANLTRNYSAVTGACLLCRRKVLEEAGMWDEKFEVEFNDIDLCLRIKELGYHNLSMADVVIYHYESLSRGNPLQTQKSRERHVREVKRFVSKYRHFIENDPCYNPNLSLKNCNFEIGVSRAERHDIIHIYDELFA